MTVMLLVVWARFDFTVGTELNCLSFQPDCLDSRHEAKYLCAAELVNLDSLLIIAACECMLFVAKGNSQVYISLNELLLLVNSFKGEPQLVSSSCTCCWLHPRPVAGR